MRRTMIAVAVAGVTMLGLVGATTTSATADTNARHKVGFTRVVVAPPVYKLVAGAGITPAPVNGAKAFAFKDTLAAKFPITSISQHGKRIKHSGGISLTAGSKKIVLRQFVINTKNGQVTAKVGGSIGHVGRVSVFRIATSDRTDLGAVRLTLTKTAAFALNTTFGVQAFTAGDTFGYATPRPHGRF